MLYLWHVLVDELADLLGPKDIRRRAENMVPAQDDRSVHQRSRLDKDGGEPETQRGRGYIPAQETQPRQPLHLVSTALPRQNVNPSRHPGFNKVPRSLFELLGLDDVFHEVN